MNTSLPQPTGRDPRRWLTLAIVTSALFMICVDMTVLYTALPVLTRDLEASASQRLWIVNVYALVVAGLLPGLGPLGDRHGHRRLFLVGLAIFGAASLGAALSPTPGWLIAARALLGAGGAAMMPATLAIIRQRFQDPAERHFAIGLWAGTASGGLAFGPVIGGLLLEHHAWGSVFLVNLPVVLAAMLLTLRYVPATQPHGGARWDLAGSLLVMAGLFGIVTAIKACAQRPMPLPTLGLALLVGGMFLLLFARQQRHRSPPLIDFTLFRLPGFPQAVTGALLGTAGIVGFELVLGQHLQLVLGRSPLQAGLAILPTPLGSLLAAPVAGRLLKSRSASGIGSTGLLLSAGASLGLLALPLSAAGLTPLQIGLLLLIGMGVGMTATAASAAIMSGAPPERAGMAASIEEVAFELGSGLGVAIFGSLMPLVYTVQLLHAGGVLPAGAGDSLDDALRVAAQLPATAAHELQTSARAAFTRAYEAVLAGTAILWFLGACGVRARRLQFPAPGAL